MSRPLPLAIVQAPGRRPDDLKSFARHVEQVSRAFPQARLLVYPELHLATDDVGDRAAADDEIYSSAEPVRNGPRHDALSQLAGDLNVWLCPGSVCELGDDGRVYNTAVVYSPEGRLVASYRKVFPWRPHEQCSPGKQFVVFDMTGHGRVGLSVCYDSWFPESTRHLAWMGAELVLNVVKTSTVDREQELVISRANAIVNQVYVLSVNAASPSGVGRSVLIDPEGRVLAQSSSETAAVLTAVIDLDAVPMVRRFGTAGVSRMWDQMLPDDEPLPLPLYEGRIEPGRWRPHAGRS